MPPTRRKNGSGLKEVDRGQFLRFCGVGAIGAAIFASSADGFLGLREARAQGEAAGTLPSPGSLRAEFDAAAAEYGVPVQVLMAMGYVNTRWEMPPLEVSEYIEGDSTRRGAHGIMALVQNPYADTLGLASRVSGIPQHSLKTDRFSNIRGGAALVSEASRVFENAAARISGAVTGNFNKYLESIAGQLEGGISAVTGVGGGMIYARQVLDVVHSGVSLRISTGENLTIAGGALRSQSAGGMAHGR